MRITSRRLEILKVINRHSVLPSNFIYALDRGSPDRAKRNIQKLREHGYIYRPEQQNDSKMAFWANSIYALTDKGKDVLDEHGDRYINWTNRQFWHQLMIAEIVCSFELACRERGLTFRTRREIIGDKPLALPCTVFLEGKPWGQFLYPDAIFGINHLTFVVEADRDQEPVWRADFDISSYRRKITQYAEVFKKRTYQSEWGIQSLLVLNFTTSYSHCQTILTKMQERMNANPRSMLFRAVPSLGSKERIPQPLLSVLDDPLERAGHPPLIVSKELSNGQ